MGVDLNKMPGREQWLSMLAEQLHQPYQQKKSYCIIWLWAGKPIGHCNVNRIIFAEEAYMDLHIWYARVRSLRLGRALIRLTLPWFFTHRQLQKICCKPYAQNPSPSKALAKAGFTFIKQINATIPGLLNFEQTVAHWK